MPKPAGWIGPLLGASFAQPAARRRADSATDPTARPAALIARVLVDAGEPEDRARRLADLVCRAFSGEAVYFAVRSWTDTTQRNDEIRAQHATGRSITWLSREYCLARSHVGRIVSTR